ncbi:MAG: 30S ribosomal protein S12 methylthiotransferase RimO [Thermodesulfovibrio sp.]|nr:30S ribosomal protein S12 methylthiotransferase RimO [Thermodesulfovibrio sp.]
MIKVHITTLGCPKNIVDSGHLAKRFISAGFVHTDDMNDADIILLNTCGFIREAKDESIEEILRLSEIKKAAGTKKLVVFGCLAKRYKDELFREIPEIDSIWGVGDDEKIIEYCKKVESGVKKFELGKKGISDFVLLNSELRTQNSQSYAYLKIAEGCDKRCTFCVIPAIRGRFRSIPPENILKEAEDYIQNGIRELILVAQDITSYGREFSGYNLASLLKDIASIDGDFHIRLLYLYPTAIDEKLLDYLAGEEKIYKYLDIPLQHSEDRLLRLMGRRGTRKEYIKLIRNIRRTIPGIVLRTTFIVGFPTETEEDFDGLVDFIEDVRFDRLGVFKYSREEGTPAGKLKGQIPGKVKERRFDDIMKRQALISLEKNRELIGKRYEALIDEVDGDVAIARLYSHAPEIDGAVILNHNELYVMSNVFKVNTYHASRITHNAFLKVGDVVTVEIVDAFDYDLKGVVIDDRRFRISELKS